MRFVAVEEPEPPADAVELPEAVDDVFEDGVFLLQAPLQIAQSLADALLLRGHPLLPSFTEWDRAPAVNLPAHGVYT